MDFLIKLPLLNIEKTRGVQICEYVIRFIDGEKIWYYAKKVDEIKVIRMTRNFLISFASSIKFYDKKTLEKLWEFNEKYNYTIQKTFTTDEWLVQVDDQSVIHTINLYSRKHSSISVPKDTHEHIILIGDMIITCSRKSVITTYDLILSKKIESRNYNFGSLPKLFKLQNNKIYIASTSEIMVIDFSQNKLGEILDYIRIQYKKYSKNNDSNTDKNTDIKVFILNELYGKIDEYDRLENLLNEMKKTYGPFISLPEELLEQPIIHKISFKENKLIINDKFEYYNGNLELVSESSHTCSTTNYLNEVVMDYPFLLVAFDFSQSYILNLETSEVLPLHQKDMCEVNYGNLHTLKLCWPYAISVVRDDYNCSFFIRNMETGKTELKNIDTAEIYPEEPDYYYITGIEDGGDKIIVHSTIDVLMYISKNDLSVEIENIPYENVAPFKQDSSGKFTLGKKKDYNILVLDDSVVISTNSQEKYPSLAPYRYEIKRVGDFITF